MSGTELSRREIEDLLRELGRRLAARGVHADIYVVGGAAMALGIDDRRVTADVAAIFDNDAVFDEAASIAEQRRLPRDWLNRNAAVFVPGPDPDATSFEVDGLQISLASPQHVLAMKMAAFRDERDMRDLEMLFDHLGITTPEHAVNIAIGLYGEDSVIVGPGGRAELLLRARAITERMRARPPKPGRRAVKGRSVPAHHRGDSPPER